MFVDEITIEAKAGKGGDGVVRWRQEKFVDRGGPWGGNGGRGGDVYFRAVRDLNLLARYTGEKAFAAGLGQAGSTKSRDGSNGVDCIIDIPVGAKVTDIERARTYLFETVGQTERVLKGGNGGLGNEHFKSSTNRAPETGTKGRPGEAGNFLIELSLIVDVGLMGLPNAGKSTLINTITSAHSRVGAYPFTTTEPHLGDFHGYIFADIPGLIEGASEGKGLGHKFLRHIQKTKVLLHCVSLTEEDIGLAYQTIRKELEQFDPRLMERHEFVVLTKSDLVDGAVVLAARSYFAGEGVEPLVISAETGDGIKELTTTLTRFLESDKHV